MTIQPIVEGYGEVEAVPVLLRRLCERAQTYQLAVRKPIRRPRWELARQEQLQRAVRLALLQRDCSAILVVLDSDDDCPKELAPTLGEWARAVAGDIPCAVVMAHREYEAWFLATLDSLRGRRGIASDALPHPEPERPRGAKEQIERHMAHGRSYSETTDQPALSALFDMKEAYARCRSFRRLVSAFGYLAAEAGADIGPWPPQCWEGA